MALKYDNSWRDYCKRFGFASGWVVLILGLYHIFTIGATIELPDTSGPEWLLTDVNAVNWRTLFSLDPGILADTWSPVIFGSITIRAHYEGEAVSIFNHITSNHKKYLVWNIFMLLFGTIGYDGLLGILVALVVIMVCVNCIVTIFLGDSNASLALRLNEWPCKFKKASMNANMADVTRLEQEGYGYGVSHDAHGWS